MDGHPDDGHSQGRRERDGWHLMREIPVALLLGLAVQTLGFSWWLSALNSTVLQQGKELVSIGLRVENLSTTVQGGSVPAALQAAKLASIDQQLGEARARLTALESRSPARER